MKQKITMKKEHFFQKLSAKFTIGFCILAILISASCCFVGYYEYKSNIEKLYNTYAYSVACEARSLVDGDALKKYAETLTADHNYKILQNTIETLRKNMDMVSIFIVRVNTIEEGCYEYLLDTLNETEKTMNLGDVVPYPEQFKNVLESCFYEGTDLSNDYIYYKSRDYGYNSFAIVPIYDSSEDIVAILMVQSSVDKIKHTLMQYIIYAVSLTVILVVVFLLIYLTYLNKKVIHPIKKITAHASSFINETSELSASLEKIHTGDEIETLADALTKMEKDIYQYIETLSLATAAKEHIAAEFNVAKQIRQNLFPCQFPAFPERKDFDIYAELHACDSVGGNFYNFFLTDDNHLCILLGDVSGNGIPTSMFSIITTTFISTYASQHMEPDKILANVNNELSKNNNAELSVDTFLAVIHLNTGELSYSTSGNMHMFIKKPGSEFEPLPFKKCFPLAAMEQVHYIQQKITLSQGDILFLHTKGIAEAVNDKGLVFGAGYAKEKITKLVGQEYSLKNITKQFFEFMSEFQNDTEQPSDSTILLFRYTGK